MDERVLVRVQLRQRAQLWEFLMAVLAATDLLQFRPEAAMGPNLNLLPGYEPHTNRYYPRVHRPRSLLIFHDHPRLWALQL